MARNDFTAEMVRRLLDYDPETGIFRWKERTPDMFEEGKTPAKDRCKSWNKRFSGKIAGYIDGQGYISISIYRTFYKAHRLAIYYITGLWPIEEVDHINRNRKDNRLTNIRECTKSNNQHNTSCRKDNSSGYKGGSV